MRRLTTRLLVTMGISLALMGVAHAAIVSVERVSVRTGSPGTQGDLASFQSSLSDDGRFVAFVSGATNLVSQDTNQVWDIFLRDRQANQTTRVSVTTAGAQGAGNSSNPAISGDGRFIAFASQAVLVAGSPASIAQIYVHNRLTGVTERVSQSTAGAAGTGHSFIPSISTDGRYVAFGSVASNLVDGDLNQKHDTFIHDRNTGATERVSVSSAGAQGDGDTAVEACRVSDDGNLVAFSSSAKNLTPGDINNAEDVFIRDRTAEETTLVSVSSTEVQGNGGSSVRDLTPDGRFLVFGSTADNLSPPQDPNIQPDVFIRDLVLGVTERVSVSSAEVPGSSASIHAACSADGRFVAFTSNASNLVPGDTNSLGDVYLRDRTAGTTERINVTVGGAQASTGGLFNSISADGRFAAYTSNSPELVTGDTNGVEDIFVVGIGRGAKNRPPVANAGPDQTVPGEHETEQVTLDGSESSDPDGDALTFSWTENGEQIATGKTPTVTLNRGVHTIKLEVKDPSGAADTDEVKVTVQEPNAGDFPLTAEALSSTRIRLKWNDPSTKEKHFEVQRSTDEGKTWKKIGQLKAVKGRGKAVTYLDKKVKAPIRPQGVRADALPPITGYYYRIRIPEVRAEGRRSRISICFALAPPTNLRMDDWLRNTPTSLFLAWQNNSIGEEGIEIETSVPDAQGNLQATTARFPGPDQVLKEMPGLDDNTYHLFRVRTFNSCGVSSWSEGLEAFTPPAGANRGTAVFSAAEFTLQTRPGQLPAPQVELFVDNPGPGPLEIWINKPTPFWESGQTTRAGFRINRTIPILRNAATVTVPQGGTNVPLGPLLMRAGGRAPLGAVEGEWVLFTSAQNSRIVKIPLHGTVAP